MGAFEEGLSRVSPEDAIRDRDVSARRAAAYLVSARNSALQRLCGVAAQIFKVEAAALAVSVDGISHIVASYGPNVHYRTYFSFFAPEANTPANDMLLHDAQGHALAQHFAQTVWNAVAGFFARRAVYVTRGCSVILGIYGRAPRPAPTEEQLRLYDQLCAMMREAIIATCRLHAEMERLGGLTLEQISAEVVACGEMEILIDSDLRLICASFAAQMMLREQLERATCLYDLVRPAARDNLIWMAKRTLQTGISPPELEMVDACAVDSGAIRVLLAPIALPDGGRCLVVRRQDAASAMTDDDSFVSRANVQAQPTPDPDRPVFEFLDETLVPRRRVNARKDVTYITLRSWRKPIAAFQVKALSALKRNLTVDVARRIGDEMLAEVRSLVGVEAFSAVVPMPCGHERPKGCLSAEIGRAIAQRTGLRYLEALATRARKGASHPKENLRRSPLTLEIAPAQPVLLVDDVATSGVHMEEAIGLLRPHAGSVLAVAWIGGAVN